MRVNALQKCFRILGISITSDYYLKINNNQLLCQGWKRLLRFGFIISFHHIPLHNGNRTEWSPIRSGENRVWLNSGQKLTIRWSQNNNRNYHNIWEKHCRSCYVLMKGRELLPERRKTSSTFYSKKETKCQNWLRINEPRYRLLAVPWE